jgi:thioredoxin-like negative regulator of GroEL
VKQEAQMQLAKEKEDVEKGYLTPDQIISKIIEITDMDSFKSKVVERKKPIVLFCMAKWCATSKQIMPFVLEKYSKNYQAWDLAILDIEKEPKVTSLLKINKVPTVLLVFNGDVMDGKLA